MEVHHARPGLDRAGEGTAAANLNDRVNDITDRAEFVSFVRALAESRNRDPAAWQNCNVESYLDAIAAWTEDMDGYFACAGDAPPDQPTWKVLGQILLAARVYE